MIESIFRFISSIRLAVFVILSLAVVSAVGTIIEARYNDADLAHPLVSRSPYLYAALALPRVNLIAVMVSRWPWQKRHSGFIMAHIGIILTLIGALITQKKGIDGTLVFEPGQSQRFVTVKERDLGVSGSMDGGDARPMFQSEVNFLLEPPQKYPYVVQVGGDTLEVTDYYHYAFREAEVLPSDRPMDGPAVRFQLENANVNVTEWIRREFRKSFTSINLGPAQVILSDGSYKPSAGQNEIVLTPGPTSGSLRYAIYSKSFVSKRGVIKQSESLETGWMGLKFRVLRHLPKARERITYTEAGHSSDSTISAVKIKFRGESNWLGLNSILRVYGSDRMYIIAYGSRRIPLDFDLRLKEFRVGRYEGTRRAASYESDVEVPNQGVVTISMNEPLKLGGFTFYQASFEEDAAGKPTASVLSVNYDPGRWIKYIGSLMIVVGSSILFWFRKAFYPAKKDLL